MTPAQKAIELRDKFMPHCYTSRPNDGVTSSEVHSQADSNAKACALIAVEELINATQYEAHISYGHTAVETTEFWLEVKSELEKL